METEKSTAPPQALGLTLDDDALASQVVEIISGISLGASPTEEEEGDDSVFYTDEDQALLDTRGDASRGVRERRRGSLVNCEAAEAPFPQKKSETGPDPITDKDEPQREKGVTETGQDVQTHQEEERQETGPTRESLSEPADPGPDPNPAPEESVHISGEPPEENNILTKLQTRPEQSRPSEKGEEGEAMRSHSPQEAQTPKIEPFDASAEGRDAEPHGEAEAPDQTSSDELQSSGGSQEELDQAPQEDHSFHIATGSPPASGPGYSTLPLPKKPGGAANRKKSFNHHTSSKYNTVSYRKIRRGNTRQKIEEFESIIINL